MREELLRRSSCLLTGRKIHRRSRNDKDFGKYHAVLRGLAKLPAETVIDGEVVAMDSEGRPSFSLLQNYSSAGVQLLNFVFDVELTTMIRSVKEQGFEGVIAKRNDSRYEPGLRSGLWQKMRVNQGQEFVVGGYSKGNPFDALIFGYYEDGKLEITECPFANLPQKKAGRWGAGLTKEKMADCVWLRPQLVAQIQFLEWTPDGNLRHTKFVGMREDEDARAIVRERSKEPEREVDRSREIISPDGIGNPEGRS